MRNLLIVCGWNASSCRTCERPVNIFYTLCAAAGNINLGHMPISTLLIATNNPGKLREYETILGGLRIELCSLSGLGIETGIDETGETFEANAQLKASGFARLAQTVTLADDSGLEVDALGGAPGVLSARYAGPDSSDSDRVAKLLREMRGVRDRAARFVCVIAVADEDGNVVGSARGACEGTIIDEPRGAHGFGYDPIFVPRGFDKTFAELDAGTKNRISHRSAALVKIIPFLRGFLEI